jgi:hypothetical protein
VTTPPGGASAGERGSEGAGRSLPLDPHEPSSPPPPSIAALDVCPNCGSPMRGRDTLVCLRCGFDLKAMRVVRTEVGEEEVKPEGEAENGAPPLVKPAPGEPAVPLIIAVVGITALLIGILLGARALFPNAAADAPVPWSDRGLELLRLPGVIAVWAACGFCGFWGGAWLLGRRLGDPRLALARVTGMVCAALVARYIDLPSAKVERLLEALAMAALYYLLLLLILRLKPRDGATILALTAVSYLAVWGGAHFITWVMG